MNNLHINTDNSRCVRPERRKSTTLQLNQDLMYMVKSLAFNNRHPSQVKVSYNQIVEEALIDYLKKNIDKIPEKDRVVDL